MCISTSIYIATATSPRSILADTFLYVYLDLYLLCVCTVHASTSLPVTYILRCWGILVVSVSTDATLTTLTWCLLLLLSALHEYPLVYFDLYVAVNSQFSTLQCLCFSILLLLCTWWIHNSQRCNVFVSLYCCFCVCFGILQKHAIGFSSAVRVHVLMCKVCWNVRENVPHCRNHFKDSGWLLHI